MIRDISVVNTERFWAKVKKSSDCWEWTAAKTEKGYGAFGVGRETDKAHRVAFRLIVGEIPKGLCLMHTCDNPGCVNPYHLVPGTIIENNLDMIRKGRNSKPPPMGGWNKKEIPKDAKDLMGKMADTEIGRMFGFSKYVIARSRKELNIKPFPCQTIFKKKGG